MKTWKNVRKPRVVVAVIVFVLHSNKEYRWNSTELNSATVGAFLCTKVIVILGCLFFNL